MSALKCSICLYVASTRVLADTVVNGQAVCLDHVGYVAGGKHAEALAAVKEAHIPASERKPA